MLGKVHEDMLFSLSLSFSFLCFSHMSAAPRSPSTHRPSPVSRDHDVLLYMALLWGSARWGKRLLLFAQLARFLRRVDSLHELLNFSHFFRFFYVHLFPPQAEVQAALVEEV